MALSILLYESETKITDEHLNKLKEFFDNAKNLKKVSKFIETIIIDSSSYSVYRVAKLIQDSKQIYSIENNVIIPSEEEIESWNTCFIYIKKDSKYVYVKGASARWVGPMMSMILFNEDSKIKIRNIDTSKIEEDIRNNSKFTSTGTSYLDEDGTKITVKNPAGLDLCTHWATKDKNEISKDHMDILIEKDELNFNVLVYPEGKITIFAFALDSITPLKIFLKIWDEIKEYS